MPANVNIIAPVSPPINMNTITGFILRGVHPGTTGAFIAKALTSFVDPKTITLVPAICETARSVAVVEIYRLCDNEAAYGLIKTVRRCAKPGSAGKCQYEYTDVDTDTIYNWVIEEITFDPETIPRMAYWKTEFPEPSSEEEEEDEPVQDGEWNTSIDMSGNDMFAAEDELAEAERRGSAAPMTPSMAALTASMAALKLDDDDEMEMEIE